ncbi:hypothetical protein MUP77_01850 [Candidatus Bathyarchaeota archaeon]|nr:hypothetical protein [Candidatus Bathyarchaeota archaeon]
MTLTKSLWVSVSVFVISLLLLGLRLLNVLGSRFDIVISWVSAISLILCGVFMGMLISEKKLQVRGTFIPLLFVVGFLITPFFGVGILFLADTLHISGGIQPIIFGGSVTGYLLLYMRLFWLKRARVLKG